MHIFPGPQEVCNLETFRGQCTGDSPSVIVAQWAKYGRMHTGRCVQKTFGYLGCDTDVLPQVDRLCSGQKSCHFKVADHLHGMQECPPDLAPFLELQYQCIPGMLSPSVGVSDATNGVLAYGLLEHQLILPTQHK